MLKESTPVEVELMRTVPRALIKMKKAKRLVNFVLQGDLVYLKDLIAWVIVKIVQSVDSP